MDSYERHHKKTFFFGGGGLFGDRDSDQARDKPLPSVTDDG